jgi:hypothetical protein
MEATVEEEMAVVAEEEVAAGVTHLRLLSREPSF